MFAVADTGAVLAPVVLLTGARADVSLSESGGENRLSLVTVGVFSMFGHQTVPVFIHLPSGVTRAVTSDVVAEPVLTGTGPGAVLAVAAGRALVLASVLKRQSVTCYGTKRQRRGRTGLSSVTGDP